MKASVFLLILFASWGARAADLASAHPIVLVLGYAGCRNLCSTVTDDIRDALARAGLRAGVDYTPLFASVDPADEGLRAYRGWPVLSGPSAVRTAHEVGFRYQPELSSSEIAHPAGFYILTPRGELSSRFEGVVFDPAAVRDAVHAAAAGEAPGVLERIALRCFHDPVSGRHSGAILAALDALVVLFAAGAGWLLWRHR